MSQNLVRIVNKVIKTVEAKSKAKGEAQTEQYARIDIHAMTDEEALDMVKIKLQESENIKLLDCHVSSELVEESRVRKSNLTYSVFIKFIGSI